MERGSCVDCEEQDAVMIDHHKDELCVTCYLIRVKAIKKDEEEDE
tara:strand:+ start:539 stop:673 length:135 start_codon:yes stop_codon:yes gene_type:complete